MEDLSVEVGRDVLVACLRRGEFALHEFAEDIERAWPVDEALAWCSSEPCLNRGFRAIRDAVRVRGARGIDLGAERLKPRREREEFAHGDFRLRWIALPLVDRVADAFIEGEKSIVDGDRRGDPAETLRSTREEVRCRAGLSRAACFEEHCTVAEDEDEIAFAFERVGARRSAAREERRVGRCEGGGCGC